VTEERAAREARDAWPAIVARTEHVEPSRVSKWRPRTRRVVPALAAAACVVLLALALTFMGRERVTNGWVAVGTLADLRRAQVSYLQEWRVFVVAPDEGAPYALSAVSPHSWSGYDEPLLYCIPSGTFVEPQHGAKFALDGSYLVGPSPSGMFEVPIRSDGDGTVEIDPSRLLPGAPRSQPRGDWTLCPQTARWSAPGFMDVGAPGNDLLDLTYWRSASDDPVAGTFVSTLPGTNCGFPVASVLQLTDPLGSPAESDDDWRFYVADATGAWTDREAGSYGPAELPPGTTYSGYRTALFELWIDPATVDQEVFVVRVDPSGERTVTRWPRVHDMPACTPPT
jgi:hypothetical protein